MVSKHWLHGLETLVTNFVDVGPIFKISAAKCISRFWKDYWYYSYYSYYSYYRDTSPTSIRAINPSTPLKIIRKLHKGRLVNTGPTVYRLHCLPSPLRPLSVIDPSHSRARGAATRVSLIQYQFCTKYFTTVCTLSK